MPTRFTEVHISSTVSSMCLRAKDHLEGTKVAVFPRNCAEQKVQTGSAAAGGHRGVATKKTTGDLTTRRGAGDPERRAEWTTVSRHGHLQSALVVVDAGVRTEWEPPTLRAPLCSLYALRRLLDGFLPLRRCTNASLRSDAFSVQKVHVECREIHFTSSSLPSRAVGVTAPPCFSRATARLQWTRRSCHNVAFPCNSICLEIAQPLRFSGVLSAHGVR